MFTSVDTLDLLAEDNPEGFANDALDALARDDTARAALLLAQYGRLSHPVWAYIRQVLDWDGDWAHQSVGVPPLYERLAGLVQTWKNLHQTNTCPPGLVRRGLQLAARASAATGDVADTRVSPALILAQTGSPAQAVALMEDGDPGDWPDGLVPAWIEACRHVGGESMAWYAFVRCVWRRPDEAEAWLRASSGPLRGLLRAFDGLDNDGAEPRIEDFPAWACMERPDLLDGALRAARRQPGWRADDIHRLAALRRCHDLDVRQRAAWRDQSPWLFRQWLQKQHAKHVYAKGY